MEDYKNLSKDEKREFWQKHIVEWKLSGKSQVEYCKEQKIKKSTLGYWHTRLSKEARFVEVSLPAEAAGKIEVKSSIIMGYGAKIKLEVLRDFDPNLLIKIIKTLEEQL